MLKFLTGLIVLGVVVFAGINIAGNFALAKVLEGVLGVEVDVRKVQLGLFTQQASVYGLKIHNPEGFSEETLASVPEISVQYDLSGLLKGTIHLTEIRLNFDEITVERNAAGKFNLTELDAMKKPPKKASGEAPPAEGLPQPEKKPGKAPAIDVVIDEVRLSLGRARYVDTGKEDPTVREFSLEIQDEILKDVTDPQALVQQVVVKTMQRVGMNALMPDMGQFSAAFKGEAAGKINAFAEKMRSSISSKVTS
ncbi:MAG: AsmA family protein [Candidatus Omnitrophota bacterium]|nr:AsmA family protein [Candidatus Omnitrophota bacterium]